jgi:ABC-type polar amino acid transport system ATPase subunit
MGDSIWRGTVELAKTELELVREDLAKAQQKLQDRPVKIVVENLDAETVRAAKDAEDRAWHARDRAFGALSEIRLLHRRRRNDQCICGLRYDRCEVARIVDWVELRKGVCCA